MSDKYAIEEPSMDMEGEKRPVIGITMGDPAGIGPEITLKALSNRDIYYQCRPLVVGDMCVLEQARELLGLGELQLRGVQGPDEGSYRYGTVDVLDMKLVELSGLSVGRVSPQAGEAAYQYVRKVIELGLEGRVDATVTNPINKEAIQKAGRHYSGHTEIYAEATGTQHYTMLLIHEQLRVVHVSTHVSLREACDRVKKKRILEVIKIADQACRDMGIGKPKIGVAGLNPHSGENGLFGTEEKEEIEPAVAQARALGILAEGPVPPDSIFSKARGGWYDIVVAMYHDQGHIPLKVCGFVYDEKKQAWQGVSGVNITLGLPIIRTSVDHGTAFDQAGKGTADETSLKSAIAYAVKMARRREGR